MSRYSFAIAILVHVIVQAKWATWCKKIQKSAALRFFSDLCCTSVNLASAIKLQLIVLQFSGTLWSGWDLHNCTSLALRHGRSYKHYNGDGLCPEVFSMYRSVRERAHTDLYILKTPDFRRALHRNVCDPVGIRTQDPQLRRLLLYPTELPDQSLFFCAPRVWRD